MPDPMQLHNTKRHFFDVDSFIAGLLIGSVFPVMVYGILLSLYDFLEQRLLASDIGFAPDFRFRTLALIAICANLIPFHLYKRWGRDNTMRGMVLPTIGFVFYWFWKYGRHIVGL
jgi:hypothetical protein